MSAPAHDEHASQDPTEDVAHYAPVVLPLAGATLIFLLAFIAVKMA